MGGMVTLQLALDAPDLVRSLVVANSPADVRLHTWHDVWFYLSRRLAVQMLGMRRVGRLLAGRLFPRDDQESLRKTFVERWAANDEQAYVGAVDAIMGWSVQDRLSEIEAPALIVSSEHDYTPVSVKNQMVAEMPTARLAVVPGARHALPVEKPEAFNALVSEFLADVHDPGENEVPVPDTEAVAPSAG
jgi:pimeloyl-ACP methyl ester carboxylesterase